MWNWQKLTGQQLSLLSDAIAESMNLSDLRRMTRLRMNLRLDRQVNTSAKFDDVVFELLEWANRKGKVKQLFVAVARTRPENEKVRQIAEANEVPLEETPTELLYGITHEHLSLRGGTKYLIPVLLGINAIQGLAPLKPTTTVRIFVAALLLTLGSMIMTLFFSKTKSNLRRWIAVVFILAVVAVALHYFHIHEKYIFCHEVEGEKICFTKGSELTEVAANILPTLESESQLVGLFSLREEIWTEASIRKTEQSLRNWWYLLWALTGILLGTLLPELRLSPHKGLIPNGE